MKIEQNMKKIILLSWKQRNMSQLELAAFFCQWRNYVLGLFLSLGVAKVLSPQSLESV